MLKETNIGTQDMAAVVERLRVSKEKSSHGNYQDGFEAGQEWAKDVAEAEHLERLELFHELPVSPVGKILKRQLRETIVERLEHERAASTKA